MKHSHPAVYDGKTCMMSTNEMIRAGARGERIACTDPDARTAIYMANRRAGYPCRIVLQNKRVYMYPKALDLGQAGLVVYPAWACSKGRDIGPETMGSVVGVAARA